MASPCSSSCRRLLTGAERNTTLSIVVVLLCMVGGDGGSNNLTARFMKLDLPEGNFVVQSPYDVPEDQRYRYATAIGVQTFWVYTTDMPFNAITPTNPHTEVWLAGHDYSSGVWQFEGYGYVPSGTSGASVRQIHDKDGGARATMMMLHVYNGTMRYYSGKAVECVYDRWLRLNVVHDVGVSTVVVYVDGEPRLAVAVAPNRSHYFKFGMYMQHHDVSPRMESVNPWSSVDVNC